MSEPLTAEAGGTLTRCPVVGVHEHAFRGPHRFREWDPTPHAGTLVAAREGQGLDVERLIGAMNAVALMRGDIGDFDTVPIRVLATAIAAEYAALAQQTGHNAMAFPDDDAAQQREGAERS
jgi:hypothetical protein